MYILLVLFQVDVGLSCAQIKSKPYRRSALQSWEIYFNTQRPRGWLSSNPLTLASETTSTAVRGPRTLTFCRERWGLAPFLQCLTYVCPREIADENQTTTKRWRAADFCQGAHRNPSKFATLLSVTQVVPRLQLFLHWMPRGALDSHFPSAH